ncbi:hypothetical protein [Loigolactobacillus backii]|uniref:hypothetical protein n=1 Tax=Loigolactobacillus backii TaxID=375175 RepID=UPI0022FD5BEB|nr:hypothetical protein [Loigolactobacillus backii]MDA5386971.1 hypothetical protein [Loigolactobacillus backii]MDA5389509.1 hypothetical protein [Loigolactobacillus backii]
MKLQKRHKRIYALYHGDKYIYDGTVAELAEYLGVSQNTIQFYTTPAYRRRTKVDGNHKTLTLIGWDDDED